MGVGKSTAGKRLAAALELPFTDLDAAVVQRAGMSIPEIFSTHGEAHFREMERQELLSFAGSGQSGVLSTGGGAPMHFDNMARMLDTGVAVWFQLSANMIASRLSHSLHKRPLLSHLSEDALLAHIEQHLAERSPIYSLAPIHVDSSALNAEGMAALVERVLDKANK